MKRWKKFLAVVSAAVVCAAGVPMTGLQTGLAEMSLTASAAEYIYGDFTYDFLDDGTIEITGYNDKNETEVEIPASIDGVAVTSIGYGAFRDCTSLNSVAIPYGVTSIVSEAFRDCTSLNSVTIPDGVTSIGDRAFYGTPWLSNRQSEDPLVIVNGILIDGSTCRGEITIPDSVTSIGDSAFYDCDSLTSITIPDSVTSIGDSAFSNCDSLTSITILDSVTSIGDDAFYDCTSLTDVYYSGTQEQWNEISIGFDNYSLLSATIHFVETPVTTKPVTTSTTESTTTTSTELITTATEFATTTIESATVSSTEPATTATESTTTIPIAATTTISTSTTTSESTTTILTGFTICGDITLDGTVTMADVILLNKAAVRLVDLTDASRANADCDLSGEVDGNDAMVLLRFQMQLIDTLPYTGT